MPLRWMLVTLLTTSCAAQMQSTDSAQETPAPAATTSATTQPSATSVPAGASEVPTEDLLDAMEKLGVEMKTLKADVAMTDTDEATGDPSTRTGTIWLQRRGPGDTRGHVLFEKLEANHRIINDKIEYLLDGDWVTDRVYGRSANDPAGKRETRRQVRKSGDKTDLLKLGEGPFPLPIGQPRETVHDQFEVTKLAPDDKEKPGLVGLELRPRESNRLSQRFHTINVWVDPHDAMPRVVETIDPNGGQSRSTKLTNVQINSGVTDQDFVLAPVGADWDKHEEPLK